MKPNPKDPISRLDRAIAAVRRDEPLPETLAASRARVSELLFASGAAVADDAPIRGCDDVQALLAAYRRNELAAPRTLLVRSHLAECASCREVFARRGTLRLATTPWHKGVQPKLASRSSGRRTVWLLAAAVTFCVAVLAWRQALWFVPAGPSAVVQAVNGALYRLDGARAEQLTAGATLSQGQVVRAGGSAQSLLRLADGSEVELSARAELSVERSGRDMTLHLQRGQIIVQAAKRASGHLYVATRDCKVAVTGTVFSVLSSLKGSRVSVVEGEVHVAQSDQKNVLHRGDQVTTTQALARIPIEQDIGWSRNLDAHLALLHELTDLRQEWEKVRLPELRYRSSLLRLTPDNTVFYAALPNYGEALNEGYRLLKAKVAESTTLQRWWAEGELGQHGDTLDQLMVTVHELSSYLGDEVVVAVSYAGGGAQPVVLAEVDKPGLAEALGPKLTRLAEGKLALKLVSEQDVAMGRLPAPGFDGAVLLETPQLAVLSPSPAIVSEVYARMKSGTTSAFATTPLGERVSAAYQSGVSLLLSADLETLASAAACNQPSVAVGSEPLYLLFERKDVSGQTLNSGELVFDGLRQGVASWLAEPAPMGALDFLTPQASAVVAFVAKQPAEVLDDALRVSQAASSLRSKLVEVERDWELRVREDLAEALGGEVAIALDGPILPTPSLKLVVEVQDADRVERAIETFVRRADQELQKKREGSLLIEHEQVRSRVYHRVYTKDAKIPLEVHYAFLDGYLVATPSRPLLTRALEARTSGENLARSSRFAALLPRDGRPSFSGIVFQDLVSVLASALGATDSTLTPEQSASLQRLLDQARPSLIGFYGEADRVELASVGDLIGLGPEALALPSIVQRTFPLTLDANKP